MERQPVEHKGNQPVPKTGKQSGQPSPINEAGSGYSDFNKDESRKQEARREESEREPWSGNRPDKVELPGNKGPQYKEPVSQTDKTAKYH